MNKNNGKHKLWLHACFVFLAVSLCSVFTYAESLSEPPAGAVLSSIRNPGNSPSEKRILTESETEALVSAASDEIEAPVDESSDIEENSAVSAGWDSSSATSMIPALSGMSFGMDIPVIAGDSAEATVFNFLVSNMGLNEAAACGVLGNIQYESGFKTTVYGDSGTSYGLCQWHNGRFSRLQNYCRENGYDYTTMEGQLHYLEYELSLYYPQVLSYLHGVSNTPDGAYDAGYYYCVHFESPAQKYVQGEKRGSASRNKYSTYAGSGPVVQESTSTERLDLKYLRPKEIVKKIAEEIRGK